MNPNNLDREEQYYRHYNQRGSFPSDGEETQAFRLYARIRHQMRNAEVPQYDRNSLIDRMVQEMEEKPGCYWGFPGRFNPSRFFLPVAYAGVFLVFLGICFQTFLAVDWNLSQNIRFVSKSDQASKLPTLWKYRLWSGKSVTVPSGIGAVIDLSDGSKLVCQSNTQIAVQFDKERKIDLKSGKITLFARPNKEKPMVVTTPLGEVHVVGTVFTVELTR